MKIKQILDQNLLLKIGKELSNSEFNNIEIDSRLIKKGDIFFALNKKGENFIGNAIKNGAILIIYASKSDYPNSICLQTKNINKDLIFALKQKYADIPENIFAVTGTKGKSSIANFFLQFMSILGQNAASIGTLGLKSNIGKVEKIVKNSPLTTPDIICIYKNLNILKKHNINNVIIEASSIGLDQGRLLGVKFKSAIFTNLSLDHLDYHKNMRNYLACKIKLFSDNMSFGQAIINSDFPESKKICKFISQTNNKILSFGKNGADLKIINYVPLDQGYKVKFSIENEIFENKINLLGDFQIYNILATFFLIFNSYKLSKIEKENLIQSFSNLKSAKGRMELIHDNKFKIYIDFAHNDQSLEKSLLAIRNKPKTNIRKLIVLFGCGGDRDKSKRAKMGKIATQIADLSIITDDNPRSENPATIRQKIISGCKNNKFIEIANRKMAIIETIKKLQKDDILMIAGKGHEKYQIIGKKKIDFDEESIVKNYLI